MQLFCMIAEYNCTSTDAKWMLFPFNSSCRFVIKKSEYLNIFFDVALLSPPNPQNIRQLVSNPPHPLDSLYIQQKTDPVVIPPLPFFPSTKYVLSMSYCVVSLCSVSAGSGQAVIFRVQSKNYTPTEGSLLELIAIGTTLRIRVVSKGKEDFADVGAMKCDVLQVMNGVQENKWCQLRLTHTRTLKRGQLTLLRNGVEICSSKMVMPSSDVLTHASVSVCSEGFKVELSNVCVG